MSRVLLDTTFFIDAKRASLEAAFDEEDDVAVAAVTIAELRVGALLATGKRRVARNAYVHDVAASIPVLDYTVEVAERHAELLAAVRKLGKPRGAHDLIIAATASASGRIVVSADGAAFEDLPGVQVRNHRD